MLTLSETTELRIRLQKNENFVIKKSPPGLRRADTSKQNEKPTLSLAEFSHIFNHFGLEV